MLGTFGGRWDGGARQSFIIDLRRSVSSGMTGNGQRQEGGEAEQGAKDSKLKTIRWCDRNDGPRR